MEYYKSKKGYYYCKYKNGKVKRLSKQIYYNKMKKGGDKINTGASADIFYPAYKKNTSGKIVKNLEYVSKIPFKKVSYKDIIDEVNTGKRIMEINNWVSYFLPVENKVDFNHISNISNINNNNRATYTNHNSIRTMVIRKADMNLDKLFRSHTLTPNIIRKLLLKTAVACKLLLDTLNVAFFDLKSLNIMIKKVNNDPIKYECYLIDFSKNYMVSNWTEFKTFSQNLSHIASDYSWAPEVNRMRKNIENINNFIRLNKSNAIWKTWANKAMVYQLAFTFKYYDAHFFNYSNTIESFIPNMLQENSNDRPTLETVIQTLDSNNSKNYSFSL